MPDPVVQLELQRWPRTQPKRRAFRPLLWFWAVTLMLAFSGVATLQVLGPPGKGGQQAAGSAPSSQQAATPPPPAWTVQPEERAPTPAPSPATTELSEHAARGSADPDARPEPMPPVADSSIQENAGPQDPELGNTGAQSASIVNPETRTSASEKTPGQNSESRQSVPERAALEKPGTSPDPSRQASSTSSARKPAADPVQLAIGRLRRQQKQQQLARGPDLRSAPPVPNESGELEPGYHDRPEPRFSPPPPPYYWPYAWAPNSPPYTRWRYFP